jgi:uncharacterized protein (DUF1499 family)
MIALSCALLFAGCTGTRPATLGVRDGRLSPCPASPNCVSSQDSNAAHSIEPLRYTSSPLQAMERLKRIVGGMKRAKVITDTDLYLHAEFTSALFRFVDDVEFVLDEKNRVIHVRSASRVGYSDLGVNRKRVEAIGHAWSALPDSPSPARP